MPQKSLRKAGIILLTEPINTRDIPGFYLNRSDQALAILDAVGSGQSEAAVRRLSHADHGRGPGAHHRAQPGARSATCRSPIIPAGTSRARARSTIRFLFDHIDACGYDGWIGCEYKPREATEAGLGWLDAVPLGTDGLGRMARVALTAIGRPGRQSIEDRRLI